MNAKRMQNLFDKAEELGWWISEDEHGWEIGQHSPAGEDFSFYIHKDRVQDADDFLREIRREYDDFDTEEHIKLWVEGSGTRGIPSIKVLVQDADDIDEMLHGLADALADADLEFEDEEEDENDD